VRWAGIPYIDDTNNPYTLFIKKEKKKNKKQKKKTIFWVGPSSCLVSVLHEAIMFRHYCLSLKSQTSYDNFLIFNRCLISARKLP
jgi:hypothetical protein